MESQIAFIKAFVSFQSECPSIDKDARVKVKTKGGGEYEFEYASFGNIVSSIRDCLKKNELAYRFTTNDSKFVCRIMHSSGHFEDTVLDMPKPKETMQENGSVLTYLKRYSLVLALGLDTDPDDDANTGDGNTAQFQRPPKEHIKDVDAFIKTKGKDLGNYVVRVGKFKHKKLSELDPMDIQQYLSWLSNQASEKGQKLTGDWLEFAKIAEAYIAP